jgi:C_GCAxxG_C_C family probable redox protein
MELYITNTLKIAYYPSFYGTIMNPREHTADTAAALFADGFHCSQAVFNACAPLFRDTPPPAELTAALAPFAGGMAQSGQICGSLSGALAVLGFTLGKTQAQMANHKLMNAVSQEMVHTFTQMTQQYGGICCSDIAAVDWQDPEAVERFRKDPQSTRRHCVHVVKETSACVYDLAQRLLAQKNTL